jgi:hypothetical protein
MGFSGPPSSINSILLWKGIGYAKRRVRGQQQLRKDWERMLDCLSLGYATYIYDHSTLAYHDRGGVHPTTLRNRYTF